MNKTLLQVLIGLLAGVALLMLAGCDEQWGIAPTVKAYRQEEVTFAVGDSTVIDADTSNGEIIIRGVEGVQEVHVVATLQTRGDTSRGSGRTPERDRLSRCTRRSDSSPSRSGLGSREGCTSLQQGRLRGDSSDFNAGRRGDLERWDKRRSDLGPPGSRDLKRCDHCVQGDR